MPTLNNILNRLHTFAPMQVEWLHQLIRDWQVIADLSFADLMLCIPARDTFIVAAHARPATAGTLIEHDVVAEKVDGDIARFLEEAICGDKITQYRSQTIAHEFVPVKCGGKNIAVLHVLRAVRPDLVPAQNQQNYHDIVHALLKMVTTGEFPMEDTPTGYRHGTPRVSDGVLHLNEDGMVLYASPNAVSNFRRLGIDKPLAGAVLAEEVTELIEDYAVPDEALPLVLMGRQAWIAEFEAHQVIVSMRAIPLLENGRRLGAVLLTRDVTEIRRHEQQLLSKDATIREINHRVKNNLQTVSALLRLQARRVVNEESRKALEQAQRRVSMIAIVHEGLSQNINEVVEFDEVFGSLLRTVRDIAVTDEQVESRFLGSFGKVRAEQATALAVVLNEIISNAIEHGLRRGGEVEVCAGREGNILDLKIKDNGCGMTDGGPGNGLGTQIVKTLVRTELNGKIEWLQPPQGGTCVHAVLHLR